MKTYIKDGQKRRLDQITLRVNNKIIINPPEEMILKDGWEEYIEKPQTLTLKDYQNKKIEEINNYDTSENVRLFYIQDQRMWFNKSDRAGLVLRFQAEIKEGIMETNLWYNNKKITLSPEIALEYFEKIEVYASQCYDTTQNHILSINNLSDIDAINSYNYTVNYPEPLRFNLDHFKSPYDYL